MRGIAYFEGNDRSFDSTRTVDFPFGMFCRQAALGIICVLLVSFWALAASAQETSDEDALPFNAHIEPVIEENKVDGILLGIGGDFTIYDFTPFLKLGYGLDSGGFRYQAGVGWQDLSLSVSDWADTPILGREGEMSLLLKYKQKHKHTAIGVAQLWPTEDEAQAPQVGYVHSTTTYKFTSAFDLSLTYEGDITLGLISDGRFFESMSHSVKTRWGDMHFSFKTGTSSNEAEIPEFEFTRNMRGYDQPLKGHSFWQARLERRTPLLRIPIPLPDLPELPEDVPMYNALNFKVDASAFGELLSVQPNPTLVDADPDLVEQQDRLGWGVGLVLLLEEFDFELRLDLFFNRSGEMKPLFG